MQSGSTQHSQAGVGCDTPAPVLLVVAGISKSSTLSSAVAMGGLLTKVPPYRNEAASGGPNQG